jgi:hypothetical protein
MKEMGYESALNLMETPPYSAWYLNKHLRGPAFTSTPEHSILEKSWSISSFGDPDDENKNKALLKTSNAINEEDVSEENSHTWETLVRIFLNCFRRCGQVV